MKFRNLLFVFFISCFGILSLHAQYSIRLDSNLFISKLSDTVYIAIHCFPWESNSLIIKASETEAVLIDTPYDSSATSKMLKWVKENLHPQKITAINTGFHVDNLGGNGCLHGNNIDIYGSDLTMKLIDERGNTTLQQMINWLSMPAQEGYRKAYKSMVFVKPNKIFKAAEGLNLVIGNFHFDIFYPGESHSPDNVVVFMEELQLLFGGCMVKSLESQDPGFTGDANMAEWPVSVRKVLERYPEAAIVIPHHGMWGDTSLLYHTLKILE